MGRALGAAFMLAAGAAAIWMLGATPLPGGRARVFDAAAIEARIEELRPLIERAVGRPFPQPVAFRLATTDQIAGVLAREMPLILQTGGSGAATPAMKALARLLMGKVELADARLNLMPASFRFLDGLTRGRYDLRSLAFRDVVLIHELVHVFDFQRIDAARYFGRSRDIDALHGPSSVIEGHAQFIAARVARRLGLEREFGVLTGLTTGDFPNLSESARARLRAGAGLNAFPYYRGRQLVARVVRERGYESAWRALLGDAPGGQLDVTIPQRYLPPDPDARAYEQATKRVARYLDEIREERGAHEPFCSVDLRLQWEDWNAGKVARALRGFLAGDRFTEHRSTGAVVLYRCRSEADARTLVPLLEERAVRGGGTWRRGELAGRAWARINPRTERVREGYRVRHRGAVVVEVRMDLAGRIATDADVRVGRCVVELVRSTQERSLWAGLKREDLSGAFIAGSRAEDWGIRWRAVRNLGRLSAEVPGVLDAVLVALADADPMVRLAALDCIVHWKRTGRVPEARRKSLREDPDVSVRARADRAWR